MRTPQVIRVGDTVRLRKHHVYGGQVTTVVSIEPSPHRWPKCTVQLWPDKVAVVYADDLELVVTTEGAT
jgi:hypothetical protein